MSYTVINFKTKKALKEAVKLHVEAKGDVEANYSIVRYYNPGLGPDLSNYTGSVALEGPHWPASHSWYAEGELVNGILVKVK